MNNRSTKRFRKRKGRFWLPREVRGARMRVGVWLAATLC